FRASPTPTRTTNPSGRSSIPVDQINLHRLVLQVRPGRPDIGRANDAETIMKLLQLRRAVGFASVLALFSLPVSAQPAPDGSHDFDFASGVWRPHITRVLESFDVGHHHQTS